MVYIFYLLFLTMFVYSQDFCHIDSQWHNCQIYICKQDLMELSIGHHGYGIQGFSAYTVTVLIWWFAMDIHNLSCKTKSLIYETENFYGFLNYNQKKFDNNKSKFVKSFPFTKKSFHSGILKEINLICGHVLIFIFKSWKIISLFKIGLNTKNVTFLENFKNMHSNMNSSYILTSLDKFIVINWNINSPGTLTEQISSKIYILKKLNKTIVPIELMYSIFLMLRNGFSIVILVFVGIIIWVIHLSKLLMIKAKQHYIWFDSSLRSLTFLNFTETFFNMHWKYFYFIGLYFKYLSIITLHYKTWYFENNLAKISSSYIILCYFLSVIGLFKLGTSMKCICSLPRKKYILEFIFQLLKLHNLKIQLINMYLLKNYIYQLKFFTMKISI